MTTSPLPPLRATSLCNSTCLPQFEHMKTVYFARLSCLLKCDSRRLTNDKTTRKKKLNKIKRKAGLGEKSQEAGKARQEAIKNGSHRKWRVPIIWPRYWKPLPLMRSSGRNDKRPRYWRDRVVESFKSFTQNWQGEANQLFMIYLQRQRREIYLTPGFKIHFYYNYYLKVNQTQRINNNTA